MKRHITTILMILAIFTIVIGLQFDVRWGGIATWAIVCLLLTAAAYFTKYIPAEYEEEVTQKYKS